MSPIVQLILHEIPTIIQAIKDRRAAADPGAPPLTSAEVLAAFEDAFTSSIAKDEMIKAAIAAGQP